ncbi:ATP-binding cassette, subfamily B [Verrucomicrobium sp. GAS474]|uniref:ABC transporter ATP-binding protein n=1 Tax=Verrucomicrobium sp. GAS474 TaxID=1882831 RepID=UPI00087CAEA0|nr:ABC transporter ATP-binding protein [Verrucomicrobium sp. GAS474]SDT89653.1 ATP-binding cassette, subfamily B [Verrucomicrobium sp. GAS474]
MQIDPIENEFQSAHPWRTLVRLYWPERRSVLLVICLYVVKASAIWILPIVTANIIDIVAHPGPKAAASLWINITVGAVAVVQNILTHVLWADHLSRSIRNVEIRLRSALVRRFQTLSIGYHSSIESGVLQTKVLRDIESVEQLVRAMADGFLGSIISIVVAIAVTAVRMPLFVPVFMLCVPIILVTRRLVSARLQSHNAAMRRELEAMNSMVIGMISMIPITRAHAVEETEIAKATTRFQAVRAVARSFDRITAFFGASMWVVLMLCNLSGISLAAYLAIRGVVHLSPGDIALLAGYFATIMNSVLGLVNLLPILTRGFDALESIGEIVQCPDIEENRGKVAVAAVKGAFRFEGVGFHYRGGEEKPAPALDGITLEIAPGETVGIVGPSGSGKSTLASLVTGFHRPTEGRIVLDGVDMAGIDFRTFRRHLAVVSQQTILFDGTVRENIVYGTPDVTDAALQEAVRAANASGFVADLPKGLDTLLGAGGIQLSGGQRQRLSIARALLRNPRVLILDEATSALDIEGEALVQQALERLMKGRTTFVIAHRSGTLRHANRIVFLEKGRIVRIGTFADLEAVH